MQSEAKLHAPLGNLEKSTGIESVGIVRSSRITSVDATLEHKDVEILLGNLKAAQARYRDILQSATDPGQILAVVAIVQTASAEPQAAPAVYQAMFATGIHAVSMIDVREQTTNGYFGTGLSLRFPRSSGESGRGFALDVDVVRACCGSAPQRSDWAFDVLTGLDLFSESLERGQRKWLNPFLGLRLGVAQTENWVDFAAAAVLGLEIWKTRVLVIDTQVRLMALVGNPEGPHGAIQPQVGIDLGF